MTVFARRLALSALAACFALTLGAVPALAKTHHHKRHNVRHHAKASHSDNVIRVTQEHLANLGYYSGKIDGIMGPQTRKAIKNFQSEHGLKVDGVVGSRTRRALEQADHHVIGSHSFSLTRDTVAVEGADTVNPEFIPPLNGTTKTIANRFAHVDVNETGVGADKRYNVSLNGQLILEADNQPSVIGISPTYDLGTEDAVIFTAYAPNDPVCTYKNYVLAMNGSTSRLLPIENCTRAYQARVDNGALYVSFPELDTSRAVGATWRLEGVSLERL